MFIGVTGATGFIGHHLEQAAREYGHTIIRFSRTPKKEDRLFNLEIVPNINGCEAFIHLAGEPIPGLWTTSKRQKILESRQEGTRRLVEGIASLVVKPRVLVCASAVGYYGNRGDEILEECSSRGSGFLADVAAAWEHEARQAERYGVRVVSLRFGLVLGNNGSFLKKALLFFRWGLGTQLGNGKQWMSCIHVEDLARIIFWCLQEEKIDGILNAVMPSPITNQNFTKILASTLHRPALFKIPAWVLHLFLGGFSHLFLDSQYVIPKRALEAGFQWKYPTVEKALQHL